MMVEMTVGFGGCMWEVELALLKWCPGVHCVDVRLIFRLEQFESAAVYRPV